MFRIRNMNFVQYLSRAAAALCFVLLLSLANSDVPFGDISIYDRIDFPIFLFCFAVLFVALCFVRSDRLVFTILVICMIGYFCLAAYQAQNYFFSFGLCLVAFVAVYYLQRDDLKFKIKDPVLWILCGILILTYALAVGIICCMYYRNYWTSCFDFGIFSQMFYYMKETGQMLTTCERDGLLSHFAVHFSPVYYLLLPVYLMFPTPETLLIAQPFIVASGIIPLVLLCRHRGLSSVYAIIFSVCYLLFPGFFGGCFFYLHENCFLAPLLLWVLYFSEREKAVATLICVALTLTIKEDAAVYVAVIFLYLIAANKSRIVGIVVFIYSVIWFICVTSLLNQLGEGIMADSRYGNYIYDESGLLAVIKSVIQNPVYAISQIFAEKKILFILQLFAPLCFLPVLIKHPAGLILLIPLLLVNLMTDYVYQYDIGFQYTFGSGSLLFYLAVSNMADMEKGRGKLILCALLSSLIIFSGGHFSKFNYAQTYEATEEDRIAIQNAFSLIPEKASVSASTFFVPNLSQRPVVYELETTQQQAEYIVIDLRGDSDAEAVKYATDGYETLYYHQDLIAVFRVK